MAGEEPVQGSKNEVKDVPDNFKQWLADNEDRAKRMSSVPYFIRDNVKFIPERFIQNMGTLKGGQDAGLIENLKEAFLKLKDPNYITGKEVQNTIKTFAQNNPDLFLGGLTDVVMNSTGAYNMAGNTIKIANREFRLVSGEIFNPLEEVKGALKAISTGIDMTFKQEYALESLWHEIRHAQAVGWKNLRNKTDLRSRSMETINQFCARHSYRDFVKSLGGKAVNTKEIIERGYGYGRFVSNFQNLLKHINVTQAEAHAHFKDIILKTPYEEIHEEIVKFVQAKSKYDLKTAKELVKNLRMSSSEFAETLRGIKGA
jgi:hypothetical protein